MAPKASTARLGVVSEYPKARPDAASGRSDYFVEHDGLIFAGRHLLIDLWGAAGLDDEDRIEAALRDCVAACGATLLNIHVHHFGGGGGISGVAVLAESHISVHTWPERGYAAIDIFMCGTCNPHAAVPVLKAAFAPDSVQIAEQKRSIIP